MPRIGKINVQAFSAGYEDRVLHLFGFQISYILCPHNWQVDIMEHTDETAHAILAISKHGRALMVQVVNMSGGTIGAAFPMSEISPSVYSGMINWAQLHVQPGYYIIIVTDGRELDASMVEISSAAAGILASSGRITFS